MNATRLIFVGGFLGAGKTTLLYEITRILKNRGKKVGIITNDQAPDLADTSLLMHTSVRVAEVSGSCFCCDFKGLRRAIENLSTDQKPDIILAEPVGSCTDLSATLINPIKDIMKTEIKVCPLTVLVDPKRLKDILEGKTNIHPGAAYIIKKQLEESDIISITKTDLYSPAEIDSLKEQLSVMFPESAIRSLSSKSNTGVKEWLDMVLSSEEAGNHIAEIDYDKYAEGEAVLGWLNCSASVTGSNSDWDLFSHRLMEKFASEIEQRNLPVGHVKLMVENNDTFITANLTDNSESPAFRWSAGTGDSARMIFNARVETSPEELEKLFMVCLNEAAGKGINVKIDSMKSLSPGRPDPTHRYNYVVSK